MGRGFRNASRFWQDETGAITVDYVVLTAAAVVMATTVVVMIGGSAKEASADVRKCMRIQGNLMQKDIPYEKQLRRIQRRCSRIK